MPIPPRRADLAPSLRPARARRLPVASCLVSLVASVGSPLAQAKPPEPPSHEGAHDPALAPSGRPDAPTPMETLLAAADDITRQVAALRGLAPKRPIERGVLSREEIGKRLKERIAKEYTPDEIKVESRVLKRLGLLPPEVDYQQLLLDLLMEQVAGFYDPYAKRLYIADWLGLDLQRPALAHEIEHALQDQHFDLKSFAQPIKDDGDRQLARSALVEGDGTAAMLAFFAQSLGVDAANLSTAMGDRLSSGLAAGMLAQASPVFTRAPRFLRETLLFPYFAGLQFVLALNAHAPSPSKDAGKDGKADAAKGPWARVDEAFRSPPESTKQVLHPERYLAHEHPTSVVAAPLPSLAPRKELRRDVLGELELRVLLASRLPDGTAERAAEGWAGDRLVAYGDADPAAPVTVLDLSTWDTDEDAKEAHAALAKWAAALAGKAHLDKDVIEAGGEGFLVERKGRDVLAIVGAPAGSARAVADEVWATWKVEPPRESPRRSSATR